ncbi:hypothetical protein JXA56_02925 [Candidatus Micrarchaeota archaeon]|nr:hypothetical protein [Candidatus Micrarchaeota archaeon]
MDGVKLAAKYSFQPNNLGYCGTSSFVLAYKSGDLEKIKKELKKFRAHYAYLQLIAKENNKDPFDLDVVKAFWIGNELLENIPYEALRDFVANELFPESPRATSLAENLPEGLVPHHSFNSLYINFISDAVPKTIENYDSCCVTFGEVLSVSEKAKINRNYIAEGPVLKQKTEEISLDIDGIRFIDSIKPGDLVSVHWGMAIQVLLPSDYALLEKYTKRNLLALQ